MHALKWSSQNWSHIYLEFVWLLFFSSGSWSWNHSSSVCPRAEILCKPWQHFNFKMISSYFHSQHVSGQERGQEQNHDAVCKYEHRGRAELVEEPFVWRTFRNIAGRLNKQCHTKCLCCGDARLVRTLRLLTCCWLLVYSSVFSYL